MRRLIGIKRQQKTIVLPFLGVLLFCASSFLPGVFPSVFSPKVEFLYLFCAFVILASIVLYAFISTILFLIAKAKKKPQSRFTAISFSLLLSFIILTPASLALHRYLPRQLPTGSDLKPFDSVVWNALSSTDWNEGISLREMMLKNLVENILPGKTKEEIESVLGQSLKTEYSATIDRDLIYYLGPERDGLINIDSEWLLIWLGKDGKFARYRIAND